MSRTCLFISMSHHLRCRRQNGCLQELRRKFMSLIFFVYFFVTLQWRHIEYDGLSNHQLRDCLRNRLFRRRSNKISKLRVTCLCAGNSPVTGEFPALRPVTRKMFPLDVVMMTNVSVRMYIKRHAVCKNIIRLHVHTYSLICVICVTTNKYKTAGKQNVPCSEQLFTVYIRDLVWSKHMIGTFDEKR